MGKTFTNSSGVGLTGTMVNHGQLNWAPEGNETHQIEPGYYSGGTLDASKVYEQGKVDAYDSGDIFKNLSPVIQEYNNVQTFTISVTKGNYYILHTQLASSNVTLDIQGAEIVSYDRYNYHMAIENCLYILRATSDFIVFTSSATVNKQVWELSY